MNTSIRAAGAATGSRAGSCPSSRTAIATSGATNRTKGWFIWFRDGTLNPAIDIFCDDCSRGVFRVHLTSKTRRSVSSRIVDAPELDMLKVTVVAQLSMWPVNGLAVSRVDAEYRAVASALIRPGAQRRNAT